MSNNVLRIIHYFGWRKLAIAVACAATVITLSGHARAATPAGCAALQAKYPDLKGKTLVNAINPHTPGYEALDPKDPSKYVGFDIDLGEAIGDCLGFKLTYKPVVFAALLTTLAAVRPTSSSRTSMLPRSAPRPPISSPTPKCSTAFWSRRAIRRRSPASTRRCAAMRRPKTPALSKCRWFRTWPQTCKAEGKPEPTLQLYDNNANCIQAILAGRADTYVNDVNTVDQAVKAYPDKLEKAIAVTMPVLGRHRRAEEQAGLPRRGDGRADRVAESREPTWLCSRSGSSTSITSKNPTS